VTRRRLFFAISGIAAIAVYLSTSLGFVHDNGNLILSLVFGIGPIAIVGVHRLLGGLGDPGSPLLRVCRSFLVSAFVLFTLMVVVQQMVLLQFREMSVAADPSSVESLRLMFRGVNVVQLGIDVAFDIFYALGTLSLALLLYRHEDFGRVIGLAGMVTAGALLVVNLAAFPHVPAERGLVDLGPVTAVWWLLVIAAQVRRGPRPVSPVT
jgi:hypothetical protein